MSYGDVRYLAYSQRLLLIVLVNDELWQVTVYHIVVVDLIVDLDPAGMVAVMMDEFTELNAIHIFKHHAVVPVAAAFHEKYLVAAPATDADGLL